MSIVQGKAGIYLGLYNTREKKSKLKKHLNSRHPDAFAARLKRVNYVKLPALTSRVAVNGDAGQRLVGHWLLTAAKSQNQRAKRRTTGSGSW